MCKSVRISATAKSERKVKFSLQPWRLEKACFYLLTSGFARSCSETKNEAPHDAVLSSFFPRQKHSLIENPLKSTGLQVPPSAPKNVWHLLPPAISN